MGNLEEKEQRQPNETNITENSNNVSGMMLCSPFYSLTGQLITHKREETRALFYFRSKLECYLFMYVFLAQD